MMIHGGEAGGEDAPDVLYVLEGERCLGELSIRYLGVDHLVDGLGDGGFGEVLEATRTCFYSVRHHEDGSLFGRRLGTFVTEEGLIHGLLGMGVAISVIE